MIDSFKSVEALQSTRKRYTISINANAYAKLRRYGLFGESFDDLISRILDFYERNQKQTGGRN
jgi:predicted CopG family antitoxin